MMSLAQGRRSWAAAPRTCTSVGSPSTCRHHRATQSTLTSCGLPRVAKPAPSSALTAPLSSPRPPGLPVQLEGPPRSERGKTNQHDRDNEQADPPYRRQIGPMRFTGSPRRVGVRERKEPDCECGDATECQQHVGQGLPGALVRMPLADHQRTIPSARRQNAPSGLKATIARGRPPRNPPLTDLSHQQPLDLITSRRLERDVDHLGIGPPVLGDMGFLVVPIEAS